MYVLSCQSGVPMHSYVVGEKMTLGRFDLVEEI